MSCVGNAKMSMVLCFENTVLAKLLRYDNWKKTCFHTKPLDLLPMFIIEMSRV